MIMTNEEIIREYREAKKPLKQIGILADENQCSKKEIVGILTEAGLEVPPQFMPRPFGGGAAAGTVARAPSVSFADSSLPEGADDGEAEWGPILPAPRQQRTGTDVYAAAVEVIDRMVADSDSGASQEDEVWQFRERVRGVLAMVYELRKEWDE